VDSQVRSREKEEVVVLVAIVVDVDPVQRLAVQWWEESIVAVLVTREPTNRFFHYFVTYLFSH
jgi:hypothetical protein